MPNCSSDSAMAAGPGKTNMETKGLSEAVLQSLLRRAPIGFAFLDRDLRFVVVNDKLAEINGVPAEAHIGRHVGEIVPALAQAVAEVTARIVKTGEPVLNHELVGETPAARGEQRWWDESWYPIQDTEGRLIGFGAMVEDITDRKRAEAAVEAARERRRRALSIETVGRLVFNLEGRILESNAAFERMSGYTIDELRSIQHWSVLTAQEYLHATARAAAELEATGKTAAYEKEMIRKDGSRWWGLFSPTRVTDQGRKSECVEFIIDISHSKEIERELKEADRRKNEFLAILAHELRNPMAPLKNGLHIIRLSSKPDSQLNRVAEVMDRQLNHLVRLVDDLLDVGRITSGKVELRKRPVSMSAVLATSIEASQALIDARQHQLQVNEGQDDLVVHGDFDRLAQVFANLLSNAAKYTDEKGRIEVTMRRDGADALIDVRDTGIGIPEADLPHVFDLFSQVRVHQGRTGGGLGIGLALVKQLVTLHGGAVHVASEGLGRGTVFTVRIPLIRSDQLRAVQPADTATGSVKRRRLRVLIVDDNKDVADSLAQLLGMQGHQALAAYDGVDALSKFQSNGFDAVLLDIGMPGMDGIETAQRLRRMPDGKHPLLVAVTGWGQDSDRQRTRNAGFDHHLVKPVNPETLTALLNTFNR
jgi:PAS domain S-box-containing protein